MNALDLLLAEIIASIKPQICLSESDSTAVDDENSNKLSVKQLKQNLSTATTIVQFLSKLLKVSRNKEIFSSIEVRFHVHL